jgi:hypothetical protein
VSDGCRDGVLSCVAIVARGRSAADREVKMLTGW